jgi:phage tail sheath protein FI
MPPLLPTSITAVKTAMPAFIGYTEKNGALSLAAPFHLEPESF